MVCYHYMMGNKHNNSITERVDKVFEIGEVPPVGVVPKKMYAWTIRKERLGTPLEAFKTELVDVPRPRKGEMIICNMAAGINYNGIWAASGKPKSVFADQGKYDAPCDFHICGSETSSIVYEVGEGVDMFEVGDEVVAVGIQFDPDCPVIKSGIEEVFSPTFRIWGYEANWGGFAQFSKVQQHQCYKKPKKLSWEEAASSVATGGTAYRMLRRWGEHAVKEGDVVLIWGGYGGLGSMAIQLVKYYGGIPVAVVSDDERMQFCMELGAKGCINRKKYSHWGPLENYTDPAEYKKWLKEALKFRREIWKIVGEKKNPRIVVEHPGESTLPTSIFVCDKGGMVCICGGTSGYVGTLDLRYLWLGQKRLQGSHAGTRNDASAFLDVIEAAEIKPMLSNVYRWEDLALAHQNLSDNKHSGGNLAVLIGASKS